MTLFLAKYKQFRFFYHCGYIPKKFEHCTSNSFTNINVTQCYRTGYEGDCKVVSLLTLSTSPINSLNSSQIQTAGTRVNNQASQLETEFKLHGDKLTAKINTLQEDFVNKVTRNNVPSKKMLRKGSKGHEKFDSQPKTFTGYGGTTNAC